MKLTVSERRYLEAAPFSCTTWGSKVFTKPFPGFSLDRAYALVRKGLMKTSKPNPYGTIFALTPSGQEACHLALPK